MSPPLSFAIQLERAQTDSETMTNATAVNGEPGHPSDPSLRDTDATNVSSMPGHPSSHSMRETEAKCPVYGLNTASTLSVKLDSLDLTSDEEGAYILDQ